MASLVLGYEGPDVPIGLQASVNSDGSAYLLVSDRWSGDLTAYPLTPDERRQLAEFLAG